MRCFFHRDTHICAVEVIDTENDAEAISRAKTLFTKRRLHFDPPLDGFEVWDLDRIVYRHSLIEQPKTA
jgi:hypothetical protein